VKESVCFFMLEFNIESFFFVQKRVFRLFTILNSTEIFQFFVLDLPKKVSGGGSM